LEKRKIKENEKNQKGMDGDRDGRPMDERMGSVLGGVDTRYCLGETKCEK
jgi:hypothetical protein